MKPYSTLALASMLLATSVPALAFQPFITDDTGTQGAGGNQVEASFTRERASAPGDVSTTRTLGFVYTRGFTDALDVFVQANRTRAHSTASGLSVSGSGNPSFGAKWRFHEGEGNGLSLAVKPEIVLPVSAAKENDGLGVGRSSHGATLILSQELAFGAVHANLFAGRERYRDNTANPDARISRLSVAPVWDIAEAWKLGVDLGTETTDAGGVRTRVDFTEIGAVYSPDKDLDFALGFIRNADSSEARTRTNAWTLGVTWRF